jgi:hypothetical protein
VGFLKIELVIIGVHYFLCVEVRDATNDYTDGLLCQMPGAARDEGCHDDHQQARGADAPGHLPGGQVRPEGEHLRQQKIVSQG